MKRYLELFFRHALLFSLPIVVAVVAGAVYGLKAPPSYTSTSTLFCDEALPNPSTFVQPVPPGGITPCGDKSSTLVEFLYTQSFVNKVASRVLNTNQVDDFAADAIVKTVTETVPGPNILLISAKASSPSLATTIVNAVVNEFVSELNSVLVQRNQAQANADQAEAAAASSAVATATAALNTYEQTHVAGTTDPELTQLTNNVTTAQQQEVTAQDSYNQAVGSEGMGLNPTSFHVIDPATIPGAPASKKKQLLLVGGGSLIGGVVVSILALVLIMAGDQSVRAERDLEPGLEVVGTIPLFGKKVLTPNSRKSEQSNGFRAAPELVEACRAAMRHLVRSQGRLRVTELAAAGSGGLPMRRPPSVETLATIGVTSCLRGEGRSTIAAGIAAAKQAQDLRVILIELDFERPSFAMEYGIDAKPGIAEILRGESSIDECLYSPEGATVGILVVGEVKDDIQSLVARMKNGTLLREIGRLCDVVVADLPPIASNGQLELLSLPFDVVVLVVRPGSAPVSEVRRVPDELDKSPSVILNGVESSIPRPLRALMAG